MHRVRWAMLCGCCVGLGNLVACGPAGAIDTPGLDNTLAGNSNVQPMGRFVGTGTLTSSACDMACAPTQQELLVLSGSLAALKVRVGQAHYRAHFADNTVSWHASIAEGTCGGSGEQTGVVSLTAAGAVGTRVNTAITYCNDTIQRCSCTYAMDYTRL